MQARSWLLFVDDERVPSDVTWLKLPDAESVEIVRNYQGFVDLVTQRGLPSAVSFDHDLADFERPPTGGVIERTGADCARWLAYFCIERNLPLPTFTIHSRNGVGADNIRSILESARRVLGQAK